MQEEEKKLLQQAEEDSGYVSQWKEPMEQLWNQYTGREAFSYNPDADALYNQYKDRYIREGKLAMEDTLGRAAALTGGYGNSYAQTAGQQTYQRYLENLGDVTPELYQLALDRYASQGEALLSQYELMAQREQQDYDRYWDNLSQEQAAQKEQAALARSQVDAMLKLGIRPSDALLQLSGYSQEYINAMMTPFSASASGGSSGSRRTSSKKEDEDEENLSDGYQAGSGTGIPTQAIQSAYAGSPWEETKKALQSMLSDNQQRNAGKYTTATASGMSGNQYTKTMEFWKKYGH